MGRLWVWKSKENHLKIDTACQKGRWIGLRGAQETRKRKEVPEQKVDMNLSGFFPCQARYALYGALAFVLSVNHACHKNLNGKLELPYST